MVPWLVRSLRRPRWQAIAGAAFTAGAASAVYAYPPGATSLYPRCLLHSVTGLYCPGCGSLRALHALLHGRVAEAVDWNAWLVAILPPLAVYLLVQFYQAVRRNRYWMSQTPIPVVGILVLAGLAFGLLRNLPIPALAWLAP